MLFGFICYKNPEIFKNEKFRTADFKNLSGKSIKKFPSITGQKSSPVLLYLIPTLKLFLSDLHHIFGASSPSLFFNRSVH
jgi:hypothetical protein